MGLVCAAILILYLGGTAPTAMRFQPAAPITIETVVVSDLVLFYESFAAEHTVENAGDASYTDVVVTDFVRGVEGPEEPAAGPFELEGNGDVVFDPGEVWRYEATYWGSFFDTVPGLDGRAACARGFLTAIDPTGETVGVAAEATCVDATGTLDVTLDAPDGPVVPGSTVTWAIDLSHVGTLPFRDVEIEAGLFDAGGRELGSATAVGPEVVIGDGDGILASGETWRYTVDAAIDSDAGLHATISLMPEHLTFGYLYASLESGVTVRLPATTTTTDNVSTTSTTAAPATTTPAQLPATGAEPGPWPSLAVAVGAAGLVVLAAVRRWSATAAARSGKSGSIEKA